MKVLVTGATGHVGTVLIKALAERGDSVTAFVVPSEHIDVIEPFCDRILYGDVRDLSSLQVAFKEIDVVFHTAGIVDITLSLKAKRMMEEVNITGVSNVTEACLSSQVKRLVYISSVHALEEEKGHREIRESRIFDPKRIRGAYAKTKAEGTRRVLEAVDKRGLDAVIVHPAGIIGPEDYRMGHIGTLISTFLTGSLNFYTSGGYNFVDVRDVVEGILKAEEKGKAGECYILSGEYHSVKELFQMMKEVSGSPVRLSFVPRWLIMMISPFALLYYRLSGKHPLFTPYALTTLASNSNFSSHKAQQELQYHARTFRETVRDTILWGKEHYSKKQRKRRKDQ